MAAPHGVSDRNEDSRGSDAQAELREFLIQGYDELALFIVEHAGDAQHRPAIALLQVMRSATNLIVGRETKDDSGSSPV